MQVTHATDHVTHAVIGGSQTIDFGISSSAEFFNILSSSLYTNQKLAVVREVLCNAWDAHKDNGIRTTPLSVTLNRAELIIRDFGKGIPKHLIGPIYGTYGASTKKNDGIQTGGFGLGCKAPFAYTDNFEVTSHCDGECTVYRMSKSSAEVEGKPGIVPIVSFPTEETGIEVKIPIQYGDMTTFHDLIKRVVANGEMNVMYSYSNHDSTESKLLTVLPFSTAEHGFLITTENVFPDRASETVLVRYGDVVYPIPRHEAYERDYDYASEMLRKLKVNNAYSYNASCRLILEAEPHSISITPSRESLSMQEKTIQSLAGLLKKFRDGLEDTLYPTVFNIMEQTVMKDVDSKNYHRLMTLKAEFGWLPSINEQSLTNVQSIAPAFMRHSYPQRNNFHRDHVRLRMSQWKQHAAKTHVDKRLATILHDTAGMRDYTIIDQLHPWFLDSFVLPVLRKAMQIEGVSHKNVFVQGWNYYLSDRERGYFGELTPVTDLGQAGHPSTYYAKRKVGIVLAHAKKAVDERLGWYESHMPKQKCDRYIVVIVPKNAERTNELKAKLEQLSRRMPIVDLTVIHKWEEAQFKRKEAKKHTQVKRVPGFVPLSVGKNENGRMDFVRLRMENEARLDTPEFYVTIPKKHRTMGQPNNFEGKFRHVSEDVLDLYGKRGVVALDTRQEEKLKKEGIPHLDDWLLPVLLKEVGANKEIQGYLKNQLNRQQAMGADWMHVKQFINVMSMIPFFNNKLKLGDPRSFRDEQLWAFFNRVKEYDWTDAQKAEITKVCDKLKAVKPNPAVAKVIPKLADNPLLQFVRLGEMADVAERAHDADPTRKAEAEKNLEPVIKTINFILKG